MFRYLSGALILAGTFGAISAQTPPYVSFSPGYDVLTTQFEDTQEPF